MNLTKYLALLFTVFALTACGPGPRDSTDPPGGVSGLTIKVDELTQCHYLVRNSGLVPRMGPNGKQLCGKDIPR